MNVAFGDDINLEHHAKYRRVYRMIQTFSPGWWKGPDHPQGQRGASRILKLIGTMFSQRVWGIGCPPSRQTNIANSPHMKSDPTVWRQDCLPPFLDVHLHTAKTCLTPPAAQIRSVQFSFFLDSLPVPHTKGGVVQYVFASNEFEDTSLIPRTSTRNSCFKSYGKSLSVYSANI